MAERVYGPGAIRELIRDAIGTLACVNNPEGVIRG